MPGKKGLAEKVKRLSCKYRGGRAVKKGFPRCRYSAPYKSSLLSGLRSRDKRCTNIREAFFFALILLHIYAKYLPYF
jgi:hypothetical protein